MCTRACPRFRNWEAEIDTHRFARERTDDEVCGIGDVLLARATDADARRERPGRRLRLGAADLRARERRHRRRARERTRGRRLDVARGAARWRAPATRCSTTAEVALHLLARTCSPTPRRSRRGAERIALVGMGCMASAPGAMQTRKAGKIARRLSLTIGLLCSKTFDDSIFEELFEEKYGIARADIMKMNIKGVFQIWTRDGALPRGAAQGGARLHPRGLHAVPRLRRRARRPLDGRHRRLQRLDARHRAHRPGPRAA